jgi:hypothetical protein
VSDADALVAAYILDRWREDHPDHADCPTLAVVEADTRNGLAYDTGVECVYFTATLRCEHRKPFDFDFAEFGELAWIIEELDERRKL